LVNAPPLRWWLRDSVARASFLLTMAYLFRDRETKLRMYPGLAPMLIMPFIFLFQNAGQDSSGFGSGFSIAFSGGFLGLIPLLALDLLRYSQQWQASDLFRAAPMHGPMPLCDGARRAVLCVLTLPLLIVFGLVAWFGSKGDPSHLVLFLPGLIALPVYALIPCLGGKAVPLSVPSEEGKAAGRGLTMILVMMISSVLAGISAWAWSAGWLEWLLLVETIVVVIVYVILRTSLARVRWWSME
jgi:ABC-2 type transport system permease protein